MATATTTLIVACNRWTNGQYDEGRVFVYYGSPAGLGATPNWLAESNQTMAYYGFAVSTAGDVNGDGYDDIVVGAGASYTVGMNKAFVYLGSPTGLSCGTGCPVDATAAAAWTFSSDQSGANLGWAAGTAGDVNDDGFSDVLVGAPLYDEGGRPDAGKVWVSRFQYRAEQHADLVRGRGSGRRPVGLCARHSGGCERRWSRRCLHRG